LLSIAPETIEPRRKLGPEFTAERVERHLALQVVLIAEETEQAFVGVNNPLAVEVTTFEALSLYRDVL